MSVRLRRARLSDLDGVMALRERLRLVPGREPGGGGFLLGCARERYAFFAARAEMLVLEQDGALAGFAIALPDPILRASELWARRDRIGWHAGEGEPPAGARIAYFEQLALAPDAPRLHAPALAFAALGRLVEGGHTDLYATTLHAPLRNAAALPLLRAAGARPVALVEEEYEGIGRVVSELHHLPLGGFAARAAGRTGARLAASLERLAA